MEWLIETKSRITVTRVNALTNNMKCILFYFPGKITYTLFVSWDSQSQFSTSNTEHTSLPSCWVLALSQIHAIFSSFRE